MEFLKKSSTSAIIAKGLLYNNLSDRTQIRETLRLEQHGFCAYSERFMLHTDETNIEHFDGRNKELAEDDYYNWYLVLSWINSHKAKKIEPFLPILSPYDPTLQSRIKYEEGQFVVESSTDVEAKNLIEYLGFNKYELATDRNNHVNRIKFLKDNLSPKDFENRLRADRWNLSFVSALKAELGIDYTLYL